MRHTAKMHLISCDTKTQGTVLCALAPYCTEGQFYVLRTQNRPLCHICKWRYKTKGHGLLTRVPTILNFKSVLSFSCGGTPSLHPITRRAGITFSYPSCGSQISLRLGAPMKFDRCAILASLYPPQVALQRRCPKSNQKRDDFIISLSLLSAYPRLPLLSPNWCKISPRACPLPCTNMNMQSPHQAFSSARL